MAIVVLVFEVTDDELWRLGRRLLPTVTYSPEAARRTKRQTQLNS